MLPSSRIKTVIELLEKIETSRVPMDTTIGDYMRSRRYIGAKDRRFIAERCYALARARARISWWLESVKTEDTPRSRVLVYESLTKERDEKSIGTQFDDSKYGPESLTEEEQAILHKLFKQDLNHPSMPESVRVECPPQYEEKLRAFLGDDFAAHMEALIPGATLDMRINSWRKEREEVQTILEKDDVETDPTPYSPWGLRARDKAYLSKTKAFQKGWVEIQDEGSQLISYLCDAKPGMQVLDFCAGGGGKTLGLAASMKNKGRIVATDIEKSRLEKGRRRYKKAGVADIIEVRPLSDEKNRKWLRRQKGTFDLVLADVPCTGTGTWRRNPDLRWRVYGPPLEELLVIQAEILDKIAKTVKPDGKLVYATCSLLPDENEEQVDAFLKRHDDFEVLPLEKAWPDETKPPCAGPYMRLTPRAHNTDAFFAAVLVRKK